MFFFLVQYFHVYMFWMVVGQSSLSLVLVSGYAGCVPCRASFLRVLDESCSVGGSERLWMH